MNKNKKPIRASFGQGWNQSIDVELIIPGNFLERILMASPTGEKHNITFKFFLILSKKKLIILSY